MLRDDVTVWMAAGPEIDLPDEAGSDDAGAVESIVLCRRGRSGAETVILVEIAPDLLGAFVVTWSAASTIHPSRSVGIPCATLDAAIIEAGARIHRAMQSGYRVRRETAFSSQL